MSMPCVVEDMGARIGIAGAMLDVPCTASLKTTTTRPTTFKRTMEGRRFGLQGTLSRREWGVGFDALDSHIAQSLGMLARDTQIPVRTLRWYPNDAVVGNLLSPQAVEWDPQPVNGQKVGYTKLPDGSLAQVVNHIGTGTISPGDSDGTAEQVVVTPGEPVSFGVWAFGGVNFSGWWRDRDGANFQNFVKGTETFAGWQWRQFTATPPSGAHLVTLSLSSGNSYARPSISWGETAHDLPGRGCPEAVIHGLSEDTEALVSGRWRGTLDATITEVG